MSFIKVSFFLTAFVFFSGCAAKQTKANKQNHTTKHTLPGSRLLGKEFASYKAPSRQPDDISVSPELEEPTGPLTLSQSISLALMRNPELAVFSWEVRAGEAKTLQAGLFPNPELEIEAENLGGSGDLQGFNSTESTIQLSQLIELAGKRSKRKRIASLEQNLAGWDYETKRIDVLTEVTRAFIEVLAAQERFTLTKELVNLAGQVYTTVSERVKAGKVSPVEETKAKIALSISKIEWNRANRILEASRKRLTTFWGNRSATFQKVEGELYDISPIPSLDQLAYRVSQNPDVARWITEIRQRRAVIGLANAEKIPDLTLKGGVRHLNKNNDNAFVLGVSIPIPLFNRNQGNSIAARHNLARAEQEQKAAKLEVHTSLITAYQGLSTSYADAIALKNEILPGSRSAFDATNEGYRFGKFSLLDVLDAQRTFFESKGRYIEVLADYHKSVADVERLIGENLESVMKKTPE